MNKIELALANIIELITTRQRKLCASLIPRCRELTVFLTINPSEIEAPSNRKVRIEEINIENYNELNRFTYLANKSYGRSETPEEVKKRLTESSLTNFRKAYIFSKNESPIGTISLGCYKKNPSVGHFRYVGVLPSRQGQGWGKYISLFGLKRLKKLGCTRVDIETKVKRRKAIFLYFSCGAQPVYELKYWHPSSSILPFRILANSILRYYYVQWINNKPKGKSFS